MAADPTRGGTGASPAGPDPDPGRPERGEADPAFAPSPSAARQLLLLVGFVCLPPAIFGGLATAASLAEGYLHPGGPLLLGAGLWGAWGTETLRRRPGHRTRLAIIGTAVGVGAAVFLFWSIAQTAP